MRKTKDENLLLEINRIKGISSIEYKDILSSINNEQVILPGFMIIYGKNNRLLFLTAQDEYFDIFVKTIRRVYEEEKNHIVKDGIFGKEYIKIDDFTKDMLFNKRLLEAADLYRYYDKKYGFDKPLFFEEDKLKANLSIIEYHLKETLKPFDITLGSIDLSNGINGVYYIKTSLNNEPRILPVYYKEEDDSFSIDVGGIFDNSIPLHMDFRFDEFGIYVKTVINEYGFSLYTSYYLENGVSKEEKEIWTAGRCTFYEKKDLPLSTNDYQKFAQIERKIEGVSWYALPFDSTLGIIGKEELLDEEGLHRIKFKEMIYVSPRKEAFYVKELASKYYQKRVDDRTLSESIKLDSMDKSLIGLKRGDLYLLETHFPKEGVSGFYKDNLSDRYFYQLVEIPINEETSIFLDKENGIEEPSDLLELKLLNRKEVR